jgi:hypothetical protein
MSHGIYTSYKLINYLKNTNPCEIPTISVFIENSDKAIEDQEIAKFYSDVNESINKIYGASSLFGSSVGETSFLNEIKSIDTKINRELIPHVFSSLMLLKTFYTTNISNEYNLTLEQKTNVQKILWNELNVTLANLNNNFFTLNVTSIMCAGQETLTTHGAYLEGWDVMQLGNLNIRPFNPFAGGEPKLDSSGKVIDGFGAEQVIAKIIKIFITFAGSLAVLAIIYAGLLYTYSNGEEDILTKAKKIWFSAILGLLLTMLSYFIVSIIQGILYSF